MNEQSLENARDAALYVFRVFQDILKAASDRQDISAVRTVLREFEGLFRETIERPEPRSTRVLNALLQQTHDPSERESLTARVARLQTRVQVKQRLREGKHHIIFGLAAWNLDALVANRESVLRRQLFEEIVQYLPRRLPELTSIFNAVQDHNAADYWGWDWWGLDADGEAHYIDTHTKPNRLYCVCALRILAALPIPTIAQMDLPHSRTLAFLADAGNSQGVVKQLEDIHAAADTWTWLLSQEALEKIPALIALLEKLKKAEEIAEENRLIVASIADERIAKFKANVLEAAQKFGHLRPLLNQFGMVHRSREYVVRKDIPSWGYNQIDDKGAFVEDWPVSYSGWGEAYGQGLAQTEDHRVFLEMIAAAEQLHCPKRLEVISTIEKQIRAKRWKNVVVLQSLPSLWEYEEVRKKELFLPLYHQDCPQTFISGIGGFMGVLKIDGAAVPVFDVFVHGEDVSDKVVVADLTRFARWEQYVPIDEPGDEKNILNDQIFVNVRDLNADDALRAKIIADDPEWLRDKPDKERFLRKHVVVNVYEKLKLEVVDASAAVTFGVESEEADGV